MRLSIIATAFFTLASWSLLHTGTAQAREYPWCAYYDPYTYNCGFTSYEQCLATVSGVGGTCRPNARAAHENRGYDDEAPRRRRHRGR
ncbi:MAG: DUF3551 domain-containing protein [Variibacter sp.]